MSAILVGIVAVVIYTIGVAIGLWIGRSCPKQDNNNWRGAIPKSRKAPPKPIDIDLWRPTPPGKE